MATTKINAGGTSRETAMEYHGHPLVVKLLPKYMEIKIKGRRDSVLARYDAVYEMAMKMRARANCGR